RWIVQTLGEGTIALLATHAPPFLSLPTEDVEYVAVERGEEGMTSARPITADVLGAVRDMSASLGIHPAALVQLARAWLFVEVEDDRQVLDALFGRALRQAGVVVLRFHGASRAKATFADLELIAQLNRPFYAMLDNVRAEAVKGGDLPPNPTEEEKIVEQ